MKLQNNQHYGIRDLFEQSLFSASGHGAPHMGGVASEQKKRSKVLTRWAEQASREDKSRIQTSAKVNLERTLLFVSNL